MALRNPAHRDLARLLRSPSQLPASDPDDAPSVPGLTSKRGWSCQAHLALASYIQQPGCPKPCRKQSKKSSPTWKARRSPGFRLRGSSVGAAGTDAIACRRSPLRVVPIARRQPRGRGRLQALAGSPGAGSRYSPRGRPDPRPAVRAFQPELVFPDIAMPGTEGCQAGLDTCSSRRGTAAIEGRLAGRDARVPTPGPDSRRPTLRHGPACPRRRAGRDRPRSWP